MRRPRPSRATLALIFSAAAAFAPANGRAQSVDFTRLGDEAVRLTQEYLRINTVNPPGNELRAVEFFARIFTAEGIPFDSATSAPGRGNIWARLKGGSAPALVLLHHTDVVPADAAFWSVDPMAATIKDDHIYGRGALDTKSLGISQLLAFLSLHRAKVPLDRDVIFVATADEEAGGAAGAGWMVRERPDVFRGVGFLLNEGGDGTINDGRRTLEIEVTHKTPFWLKLTATGRPGHGSAPGVETPVKRLIRALAALQAHEFAPKIGPAVDAYFKGLAPAQSAAWQAVFRDMASAVQNRITLHRLHLEMPWAAALTRNTCAVTMLRGSSKINTIPPEAEAQVDCRLLPEQDHEAFFREIELVVNDPAIRIDRIIDFTPAVSATGTPLWTAIEGVTRRHFPDVIIMPSVNTGFTDSHFFRDLGIVSYGFSPFFIPDSDGAGVHGNDERISLENVRRGARIMYEIVLDMVQ